MSDERALFAEADMRARVPVELVAPSDGLFRDRLEQALEPGYRLAAVILADEREAEDATHDAVERAWRPPRSAGCRTASR